MLEPLYAPWTQEGTDLSSNLSVSFAKFVYFCKRFVNNIGHYWTVMVYDWHMMAYDCGSLSSGQLIPLLPDSATRPVQVFKRKHQIKH